MQRRFDKHAWTEDNPIHMLELVVKEANTTQESLHFNHEYDIPDCWITLYRKLRGGTHAGHTHLATS